MLILVSGGSASGKSRYAEELVVRTQAGERIYVATMQVWDAESRKRVERHRAMRAGKGFRTVERPVRLGEMPVSYTHLDVYTRQGLPSSAGGGTEEEPRRLTHRAAPPR